MIAKLSKKLIAFVSFMSVLLMLAACGETPMPGSAGTYYFVYEKGPLKTHTDYDAALLFMQQIPKIAPCYYVFGNHLYKVFYH